MLGHSQYVIIIVFPYTLYCLNIYFAEKGLIINLINYFQLLFFAKCLINTMYFIYPKKNIKKTLKSFKKFI